MAFGGLRGTLTGFGTSIVTPETADGSVAVSLQDLVVVFVAEAAANTVTTVTDNLGQTYTAINAGTLSVVGLRGYYRYVTVAGTLTQVSCVMTSSSNDHAISVAVYEGPFTSIPLDRAPTNTTDAATPYTCAATAVLSQANELIVAGLGLHRCQTATATAPNILALNTLSAGANTNNAVSSTIGQQLVAATTSVTPVFASSGTITGGVQIVATFRQGVLDTARAAAAGTSTVTAGGNTGKRIQGAASATSLVDVRGSSDVRQPGSASATGAATAGGNTGKRIAGSASATSSASAASDTNIVYWKDAGTNIIKSNFNLDVEAPSTYATARASLPHTTGLWYCEIEFLSELAGLGFNQGFGVSEDTTPAGTGLDVYNPAQCGGTRQDGFSFLNGFTAPGSAGLGASVVTGTRIGLAVDCDHQELYIANDNTWIGSSNPVTRTNPRIAWYGQAGINIYPWVSLSSGKVRIHASAATQTYAAPTGYTAWGDTPAGNDTGAGSASAVGTATGKSPSTGVILVAHAEGYGGESGGVTNPADTTGANLLVLHVTNNNNPTISDSKGNTWVQLGASPTNSANGRDRVLIVSSHTPNVGPGHYVTYTGGSTYSSVELLAFNTSTPWTFEGILGAVAAGSATGPSLTPRQGGELIIATTAMVADTGYPVFISASDGLEIITSNGGGAYSHYGTASAYKVHPDTSAVDATWTVTGATGLSFGTHILAFSFGDGSVNVAAALNGGSASASSTYSGGSTDFSPNNAISGSRDCTKVGGWGAGGGWNDNTYAVFPDTLDVAFDDTYLIQEIDVVTLKDNYTTQGDPTLTDIITVQGNVDFLVQYWDGGVYQTIETVTGNNKVWRQFIFPPISTNKVRISISASTANDWSRLVEVEAWTAPSVSSSNTGTGTASGSGVASGLGRKDVGSVGNAAGISAADASSELAPDNSRITEDGDSRVDETGAYRVPENFGAVVADTGVGAAVAASSAVAIGRSDALLVATGASIGAAVGVVSTDIRSIGAATGAELAAAGGRSDATAAGAATGAGLAAAGGRSDATAVGAAAAASLATGFGRPDVAGTGVVAGAGLVAAIGRADAVVIGVAAGVGTASGSSISSLDVVGVGAATGVSLAVAPGRADVAVRGVAAGVSAAAAVGDGDGAAAGAAAGTGAAQAASRSDVRVQGAAAAVGLASSATRIDIAATGSAAAISEALSIAAAGYAAGLADAAGHAQAVGRGDAPTVGVAAGTALAAAAGRSDRPGHGVAAAAGVAAAVGDGDGAGAGASAGAGLAAAVGRRDSAGTGVAAGTSLTAATGRGDGVGKGSAAAAGVAAAVGRGDGTAIGSAAGASLAAAVGRRDSAAAGAAAGASLAAATGRGDGVAVGSAAAVAVAAATGRRDAASRGLAASVGVASGNASRDAVAVGVAVATGLATGRALGSFDAVAVGSAAATSTARAVVLVVGKAAATSAVDAISAVDRAAAGSAAAAGLAAGTGASESYSVGIGVAVSAAVAFSVDPASINKIIYLRGYLPVPPTLTGQRDAVLELMGHPSAPIPLVGQLAATIHLVGRRSIQPTLTGDMGVP